MVDLSQKQKYTQYVDFSPPRYRDHLASALRLRAHGAYAACSENVQRGGDGVEVIHNAGGRFNLGAGVFMGGCELSQPFRFLGAGGEMSVCRVVEPPYNPTPRACTSRSIDYRQVCAGGLRITLDSLTVES